MSYYPSYQDQFKQLNPAQRKILEKIPHVEEIEGWLLLVEAVELFSLAKQLTTSNPVICEIGTWKGRSAYVFASAAKENNGLVYCIDPFNGDGDRPSKRSYQEKIQSLTIPLKNLFENTMKYYSLLDRIITIPLPSQEARLIFKETKIDLLFIDGNHDYEAVKKDYELWSPLISSNSVIVLHDVGAVHVSGPKKVWEECVLNNHIWKNAKIIGEMGIATKA